MRRHTTVNLDSDLLAEARKALGTSTATETIHHAMQIAVDRDKRLRLLTYDLPDLTPEAIEEMRKPRVIGAPGHEADGAG